jgi:hypothetical protein
MSSLTYRTTLLLKEHAASVVNNEGPLSLILSAKLSIENETSSQGQEAKFGGYGINVDSDDDVFKTQQRARTESRRNSDGLGIARRPFKFVISSGVLFCFSNAVINPKGKRSSISSDSVSVLLDSFPLSICHLTIDPATTQNKAANTASPLPLPSISLFSSVGEKTWLLTLYFNSPSNFQHWKRTMIDHCASSDDLNDLYSESKTRGFQRTSSYSEWVHSSPTPQLEANAGPNEIKKSMALMEDKANKLKSDVGRHKKTFLSELKATTHLFGCEVGWRQMKLIDNEGDVGTSKHGHQFHHTRATRKERVSVHEDQQFWEQLSDRKSSFHFFLFLND